MDLKNVTYFVKRTDLIKDYLKEINRIPILTKEKELELFKEYESCEDEDRKIEIRNTIISSNLRFVFAVAKRFATGDTLPDLINQGNLGMFEAFEDYDYHTGNRFITLAGYYVRRAINSYLAKENLIVRPTNNTIYAPKVKKIESNFFAENGRMPSGTEILNILNDEYGIDIKNAADIAGVTIDYIDDVDETDDDASQDYSDFSRFTASENDYVKEMEQEDISYNLQKAFEVLTEREATIMKMASGTFGYNKEYKDKEIAEVLNLTTERIRQLRHGAQKKMAAAYASATR